MAKERQCIFCGHTYQYCPTCAEDSRYPKWMFNFDTEKCHDLYEVVGGYNIGVKTKEDIKAILDKHNITDYSEFSEGLKKKLEGLFPTKKQKEIAENVNEQSEEKYISPRNRRYRKSNTEDEANTIE